MLTLRDRAMAIVGDLWHLAQPEAMYAVVEDHLRRLLEDEAKDLVGVEPECTCYEAQYGHQQGCYFYPRPRNG